MRTGALILAGLLAARVLAAGGAPAAPSGSGSQSVKAERPRAPVTATRDGRLLGAVDLAPAFGAGMKRQLSNGLTNVIVLHVALLPEGDGDPVALYGREIDVLYDVWDETYSVTVKDAAAPRGRVRVFRSYDDLRLFLAHARDVDLGPAAALGAGRWVLQARVELNPVSKELLDRTRELLANPAATGRGGTPSRSVLGAMAGYLLKSADPGEVVHLVRSPPFTASEVVR